MWRNHSVHVCPNCNYQSIDSIGVKRLKFVDLIWINREYESFEWFMNLLAELKIQQSLSKKKFFNTHLYWTDRNNSNSLAMEKFNQIISSIPDSPVRQIVEEMFLSIKKGRPDFYNVILGWFLLNRQNHQN